MRGSRVLAVVLLLGFLLPAVGCINTVLAEEDPIFFDTTESFYFLGDPVGFIGEEGYVPDRMYNVTVYRGDVKSGIEFDATGADVPEGIVWDSSGKEPGTYTAELYNVTDNELWHTVHFGLWGTDKVEYTYPDVVTISGGGVGATRPLTINITNGTWVPAGYPKKIKADGSGEFLEEWDFYDASTGIYTITVNGTWTFDDEEKEFRLQTTVELTVTAAGRAESVLQDIENKKLEIQDYVEEGLITDLEGSLIAKLSVTAKKVQQAIDWLGTSRDKVAKNMLKAAGNILKAFINHVKAQSGKHIDSDVADALIEQAEHLLELIQGLQEEVTPSLPPGKSKAQPSLVQPEDDGNGNNGKGNGKGKGKGKGKPA